MCNLYSLTKGQAAVRDWFRARHDRAGNLPLFPSIFPDQLAPIVRVGQDGQRELVMARWGMPGPPQYGGQPVTNIRNLNSPHWRGWLGKGHRCLVPATSFCEYADTKPRKTPIWFALSEDRRPVRSWYRFTPSPCRFILTTASAVDQWLEAETAEALALQRPLRDDALRIVAKGEKEDGVGVEPVLPLR